MTNLVPPKEFPDGIRGARPFPVWRTGYPILLEQGLNFGGIPLRSASDRLRFFVRPDLNAA